MTNRSWIVLTGFLLGALLCASQAVAQAQVSGQSLQEAKQAFLQGQEAYDRGDYTGAIASWQHSFELSQKVSLFYNIGLAYERIGKLADAAAALERFVNGTSPDDTYLDRGRARLALIRERLAQTGVLVVCNEEGATILVDDRDVGRTPRPDRVALAPGNHRVIVRKQGFADFRGDVALSGGQELTLEVTLTAAPDLDVAAAETMPEEGEPTGSSHGLLGPALMIGGGAVAVGGIVVGAVALSIAKDAKSQSDADSARTFALVADISMVVGVAAAAVGTYLWLAMDSEPATSSQVSLAVEPRAGGALFSAGARF